MCVCHMRIKEFIYLSIYLQKGVSIYLTTTNALVSLFTIQWKLEPASWEGRGRDTVSIIARQSHSEEHVTCEICSEKKQKRTYSTKTWAMKDEI